MSIFVIHTVILYIGSDQMIMMPYHNIQRFDILTNDDRITVVHKLDPMCNASSNMKFLKTSCLLEYSRCKSVKYLIVVITNPANSSLFPENHFMKILSFDELKCNKFCFQIVATLE